MANVSAVPTCQNKNDSSPAAPGTVVAEARGTALEFLRLLAAELSGGTVDLPCFPDVVVRIRAALDDPNTKPEKVVTIIGAEPRLAARLLQTANSAAFNTSGKPLVDLRSAITRLGYRMVQSATMSYAVLQMKYADQLRAISRPLSELWSECIVVASISQAVAARTKVSPDEAFLTGLLHAIGRLYIMARAVHGNGKFGNDEYLMSLVADWHPQIGKAVLENWGFAEEMSNAVGEQDDQERRWMRGEELSDILVVSVVLAAAMKSPTAPPVAVDRISAFQHIGLAANDCAAILTQARQHLGSLHDALGG